MISFLALVLMAQPVEYYPLFHRTYPHASQSSFETYKTLVRSGDVEREALTIMLNWRLKFAGPGETGPIRKPSKSFSVKQIDALRALGKRLDRERAYDET